MKVYLVKKKWLADPLCNNDQDWQVSLVGKKIERKDFYNMNLKRAKLDHYEVYETPESAKTLSDHRFNHEPDEYDNPDTYTWCDIYEIEIDGNDNVLNIKELYYQ